MNEVKLPQVGCVYYVYDDGKISLSREYMVIILKVYKAWRMPLWVRFRYWREKRTCACYADKTDYVIKAYRLDDVKRKEYFVRSSMGEWFGLGIPNSVWDGGLLDVDGNFHRGLIQTRMEAL